MSESDEIMVSVMVVVFNHQDYLRRCLDGILMQKVDFKIQICIHDDASTDDSAKIIRDYSRRYPTKITAIIEEENCFSRGISFSERFHRLARGKYIAYCEGDDFWTDENKLQIQVDFLESHPSFSGSTHNEVVVNRDETPWPDNYQMLFREKEDCVLSRKYLLNHLKLAHTASFVLRRSILTDMSKECKDYYYTKLKVNGDMKISALMIVNGDVYHFARDMACYRFVVSGGYSWSARNAGKNIYYTTISSIQKINAFLVKYYQTQIDYSEICRQLAFASISYYFKHPSRTNFGIMKKCLNSTKYHLGYFLSDLKKTIKRKIGNQRKTRLS